VQDFLLAYRELIGKLSGTLLLQHLVAVHYEQLVLPLLQRGPPSLTIDVLDLITISRPCTLSPERLREVVQHACRRAADSAAGLAEQVAHFAMLAVLTNDLMYPGAAALCLAARPVPQQLPLSLSVQIARADDCIAGMDRSAVLLGSPVAAPDPPARCASPAVDSSAPARRPPPCLADCLPLPAGCLATPGAYDVARAEAVRCGALESVAAAVAE
jgi:hypothetical protein